MDDLTFVVNSCDKNSDLWYPFFELLKINWGGDFDCPIVLNTESLTYDHAGIPNIETYRLYDKQPDKWCQRYVRTLRRIKTKYVFCLLDDDFVQDSIDKVQLEQILKYMDNDSSIACFDMRRNPYGKDVYASEFNGFLEEKEQSFRFILNCALWRREYLLKYLEPYQAENPWQLEGNGMERSKKFKERFFAYNADAPRVIEYQCVYSYGYGVWGGKWLWKNQDLFKKYGINVDFSKRGIIYEEAAHKKRKEDIAQNKKSEKQHLRLILQTVRSILSKIKWKIKNLNAKLETLRLDRGKV